MKPKAVKVYSPKEIRQHHEQTVKPKLARILAAIFRKLTIHPEGPVTHTKDLNGSLAELVVIELRNAGWHATVINPPQGTQRWSVKVWTETKA